MSHFRADKDLSDESPARMNRSWAVAWAVSAALHMLVLALAADKPWIVPREIGALVPRGALPVHERIVYLSIAAPQVPAIQRASPASHTARRMQASEQLTASDLAAANDTAAGELPAPGTTLSSASAPIVNAPVPMRVWLSPSRTTEAVVHGGALPLRALRIGLGAAIAAAADSIEWAREKARAASNWTLKIGARSRLGISPMRVHLGLFDVPVPVKVISLRDFEPLLRTRRLMLNEVYEQRDRAVRDSVITESIAALRARSQERARSPR